VTPIAVSIAALGVAALSLVVSFTSYRAGGPRVVISARRITEGGRTVGIRVEARNSGRGAITLNLVQLEAHQPTGGPVVYEPIVESTGATLPYRLDGNAACEWILDTTTTDISKFLWRHEHNLIIVAAQTGGRRRLGVLLAES
jgi:hypothetical protein